MDAKKMGVFIAQCRKQCGMTQSDLASKIYVTDKAVSRWERGVSQTKGY
jgi:transcriptional regulator with XRE-family HTH domain